MLFGTKEIFGIEIEINNFFHDKWIGEGKFIVHICGKPYGLDEQYATILYSIPNELYNFCQRLCNTDMELESFDGNEIAKCYYLQNYSETNLSDCDKDFLNKTKNLLEWSPEAAFDDGSHVMHFDDGSTTRIIGFKSCIVDGDCKVMENSVSNLYVTARLDTYDQTGTKRYQHTVNINSNAVIAGNIMDMANAFNIKVNDTSGVRSQIMNDVRQNKVLRIDYFRID